MRIRSIRMVAYGGVIDAAPLPLQRGLNVLLGENEAGKSTLVHAFSTLLFGFSPARLDAFPYRPWYVDRYPEIEAEIELDDGTGAELHRKLQSEPQGTYTAAGLLTQLRNRPIEPVHHVTRQLYEALYALAADDLKPPPPDQARSIEERLTLGLSALPLRPVSEVVAELNAEAAREWRADERGKPRVKQLRERLRQNRALRRELLQDEERTRAEHDRLDEAAAALERIEAHIERLQADLQRWERLAPLASRLDRIEEWRAAVGDEAAVTQLPEDIRGRLDELEGVLRAEEGHLERQWAEIEAADAERVALLAKQERGRPLRWLVASVALLMVGVALGVAGSLSSAAIAASVALASAAMAALGQRRGIAAGRRAEAAVGRLRAMRHSAEDAKRRINEIETAREAILRNVQQVAATAGVPWQGSLPQGVQVDVQADKAIAAAAQRKRLWARILEHEQQLAEEYPDLDRRLEEIYALRSKGMAALLAPDGGADLSRRLGELQQERERLQHQIWTLQERLRHRGEKPSLSEVEGEASVIEAEIGAAAFRRDRMLLLSAVISEAERRFRERHRSDVLRRSSAYLRRITRGRYTAMDFVADSGGDQRLVVMRAGMPDPIPAARPLSRGTLDQIALAYRLAVVDSLDAGRERLPILLDEALVHWDDARLQAVCHVLTQVAAERQVLLLTARRDTAERAAAWLGTGVRQLGTTAGSGSAETGQVKDDEPSGHLPYVPRL